MGLKIIDGIVIGLVLIAAGLLLMGWVGSEIIAPR